MKTNNAKVKNVIISLYFILIVLAVLFATLFSVFQDLTGDPVLNFFLVLFGFMVLFLITHRISKFFEYDSDGVKVVILNKGLLIADYFNYREHRVEFEKHKLRKYKYYNYIVYKRLVLFLVCTHNPKKIKIEKFNVTLVSRKKIKYIRQSLNKMIRENRKKQA